MHNETENIRIQIQIFYCFTLFVNIITLTVFSEITLIEKRKEYNNTSNKVAKMKCALSDQSSIGFRVGH